MTKALRPGKVLVDWSQNSAAKTTVAVYALRARPRPTVSTPISWDEVESCHSADDLVFTSDAVLARSTRASTASEVKTRSSALWQDSTSSQLIGVETVGRGRA